MIFVRIDFVDIFGIFFGVVLVFVVVDKNILFEFGIGCDDGLVFGN